MIDLRITQIENQPQVMFGLKVAEDLKITSRRPSHSSAICDASMDTSVWMSTHPSSTIQCRTPICDW